MNARPVASASRNRLFAGAFVLIIALPSAAAEPAPALHVKVLPDHYAVSEQRIVDLAGLESSLARAPDRVLRFDSCGAAATPALLAAVERLHGVHAAPIEIHAMPANAPGCDPVASPPRAALGLDGAPDASSYYAIDGLGRSIMP